VTLPQGTGPGGATCLLQIEAVLSSSGDGVLRSVLGRVMADAPALGLATGAAVIAAVDMPVAPGATCTVMTDRVAPLPDEAITHAALIPLLAVALAVVELLEVEIGDCCVVAGDSDVAKITALAASWAGALPVILVSRSGAPVLPEIRSIQVGDMEATITSLTAELRDHPGVVAVDLSGVAEMADMLLQSMPMFSRVVLGGEARQPLTIDFYTNVHRKGLILHSTTLDEAAAIAPAWAGDTGRRFSRALALLSRPGRVSECRAAIVGG
jgi:threonine dehydrogenase-like Zn-dependent dehydrogenase